MPQPSNTEIAAANQLAVDPQRQVVVGGGVHHHVQRLGEVELAAQRVPAVSREADRGVLGCDPRQVRPPRAIGERLRVGAVLRLAAGGRVGVPRLGEGGVDAADQRVAGLDRPEEVVLEVEYEEIQESPEYGSGYALRFPRFLGVREDLGPTDADTLSRVASLYESQ